MKYAAIYLLGFLVSLIELILSFFNKSLCGAYSCKLVASYVKYGEGVLITIGVIVFGVLAILELSKWHLKDKLIDALLISAFSTEGLLLAFQIFSLNVICYFCFSIFLLFAISVFVRLIQKHYSMIYAIFGFLSVFFIGYLIMPNLTQLSRGYDLFYSKTCPHCEKTIQFINKHRIEAHFYNAENYKNFLNNIGIDQVPVLFVNTNKKKEFIIGQGDIESYFITKNKDIKFNLLNSNQSCIIGDNCTQ